MTIATELSDLVGQHFGGEAHVWVESETPGGFLTLGFTPEAGGALLAFLAGAEQNGDLPSLDGAS